MKLNRLQSAAVSFTHDLASLAHPEYGEMVRRIEAIDEIESDRQRSLPQELASVANNTLGQFQGEAGILENAQELAERIAELGPAASELLKPACLRHLVPLVDEAV